MRILLDTCAIIFISERSAMRLEAISAFDEACRRGTMFVTPVSAWEIGRAVASRKLGIAMSPLDYFNSFLERSGVSMCDLSTEILVQSSFLPEPIHRDPMDRLIIETARQSDFTLATRDNAILTYSRAGHVKTLAC